MGRVRIDELAHCADEPQSWMVLIDGVQWGPNRDASGAGDAVYDTREAAVAQAQDLCAHLVVRRRGYELVEDTGHFQDGEFWVDDSYVESYPETFGDVGEITYHCADCEKQMES